jgi:UDP-apiose/xylose synthase
MTPSYRRVAVLGAGGFLGSHLVPALRRRFGAEVVAVDVDLGKLAPGDAGIERREVRLDHPGLVDEVVEGCEVVLSLTAICNPSIYNQRPLEVIDASYGDLLPLVKACARRGRWLVHFSTCEVYGKHALDAATGQPTELMHEDGSALWLGPVDKERWSYACAKQLLERTLFAYGRHHGLPFSIVRPFNVIGPRMDFVDGIDGTGVPRVLAAFMGNLLKGEDLLLVDGGQQRRSFIFVDEFVAGVLAMLARPALCQGEIFNLGHPDNDVTIAQLADALAAAYVQLVPEARPRTRVVSARELYGEGYDDSSVRIPDIGKARTQLGFAPTMTLAEMLPPIIADYRARYLHRVPDTVVQAAR